MKHIIFIVIFTILFVGCLSSNNSSTNTETLEERTARYAEMDARFRQERIQRFSPQADELKAMNLPLLIRTVNNERPNSAGGVNVSIHYYNISEAEIIYVRFRVVPYNRVNDVVNCTINRRSLVSLQSVGPHIPDYESFENLIGRHGVWSNVWWNRSIDYILIDNIEVEFMDGTIINYDTEKSNMMIYKE